MHRTNQNQGAKPKAPVRSARHRGLSPIVILQMNSNLVGEEWLKTTAVPQL